MTPQIVTKIEDLTTLNIEQHIPVYVEKEKRTYIKNDNNEWEPVKINSGDIQLSLYDMNKQIISQINLPTEKELEEQLASCDGYHINMEQRYYLLYGKEISYFTLFENNKENCPYLLSDMVKECLENIGQIKVVGLTAAADAVEIWVKPYDAEDVTCLYLFGYDNGIVQFGG